MEREFRTRPLTKLVEPTPEHLDCVRHMLAIRVMGWRPGLTFLPDGAFQGRVRGVGGYVEGWKDQDEKFVMTYDEWRPDQSYDQCRLVEDRLWQLDEEAFERALAYVNYPLCPHWATIRKIVKMTHQQRCLAAYLVVMNPGKKRFE